MGLDVGREQELAKGVLCRRDVLPRRAVEPVSGVDRVGDQLAAVAIERAEVILRAGVPGLRERLQLRCRVPALARRERAVLDSAPQLCPVFRALVALVQFPRVPVLERDRPRIDLIRDSNHRVLDCAELLLLGELAPQPLFIFIEPVDLILQFHPSLVARAHNRQRFQLIHDLIHLTLDRLL